MKIKLITNSTSCLPLEYMEEKSISYLESRIEMNGNFYNDLSDINREEFIKSLEFLDPYPKTTLANPQDALDIFEKALSDGYDEILYIGLSHNVSNQFNVAKIASKRLKNAIPIHLFQSDLMGPSQGAMVIRVVELLEQGKSVNDILPILEDMKNSIHTVGCSADFNTLFRTGKVKKGVGITVIASVMSLKPVYEINLEEGVVGIGGGPGNKSTFKKIVSRLCEKTSPDQEYDLFLSDALAPRLIPKLLKEIRKLRKINRVEYWKIPPVIAHSVGQGSIMATLIPSAD